MDKKAVSVHQIYNTRIRSFDFSGYWEDSFGAPEFSGAWLIWGSPGNGKTRFALQLAKYLAGFGKKVAYNSLEEGVSKSLKRAIMETNMHEVARYFMLLDKEPMPELIKRLERKKSPQVIIIDSVQYSELRYADYLALRARFRNKLFILISHARGKLPQGRVAESIQFDASVKVFVTGYVAYPLSRYGGGEPFVIWEEGAAEFVSQTKKV